MCGICGSTSDPGGADARRMNARMVHRGPDDDGVYVDPEAGVALGARRLSIIDVAGGHQPLSNEEGTVWAALNGEIYNHPELQEGLRRRGHKLESATDTEVLVHLYEDFGDDLVHALEGMYAFAIWDTRRRRLLVVRDRFGEKPLFFSERDGVLTFASELTALLAAQPSTPPLNPAALDAFFVLGYVPAPDTVVSGVRQLQPGHLLVWDQSARRLETRRYWSPPSGVRDSHEPFDELVSEAGRLLDRSVRSRMISDVPLGVFLSGGVDSSLVAALAARASREPIGTYTVGYDVGDVGETAQAAEFAKLLGAEHHELILSESDVGRLIPDLYGRLDQPLADQALLPLHAISAFARSDLTVAVGGEGADELFGGYPRYRWLGKAAQIADGPASGAARHTGAALARLPLKGRARRIAEMLGPVDLAERHLNWVTGGRRAARAGLYGPALMPALDADRSMAIAREALAGRANGRTVEALMRHDQLLWLPDDVLAKADRAGMLTSLEIRTAYLNRDLAEFAASVPTSVHLQHGGKGILRALLERLEPQAAHQRRKTAFRAPAAAWLRGPLAPALQSQLEAGRVFDEGWFDRTAARRLAERHAAGPDDCSGVLWPLLTLGLWLDGFRDSPS